MFRDDSSIHTDEESDDMERGYMSKPPAEINN